MVKSVGSHKHFQAKSGKFTENLIIQGDLYVWGSVYSTNPAVSDVSKVIEVRQPPVENERVSTPTFEYGQVVMEFGKSSVVVEHPEIDRSSQIILTLVRPDPVGPVVSVGKVIPRESFEIQSDIFAGINGITVNWCVFFQK